MSRIKNLLKRMRNWIPIKIEFRFPRTNATRAKNRIQYQERLVDFGIQPGDRVLDIGSGADPFPKATVLIDRYKEPTQHRHKELVTKGKAFSRAAIENLPFGDKSLDYIYCSHALEHVDDPVRACRELIRVGKRGFIETPARMKDTLFAWARGMHKWHVIAIRDTLCFFEYSERELDGVRSNVWNDLILGHWTHPMQKVFLENQDLFNMLFTWTDSFSVVVFRQDGTVESANAPWERKTCVSSS